MILVATASCPVLALPTAPAAPLPMGLPRSCSAQLHLRQAAACSSSAAPAPTLDTLPAEVAGHIASFLPMAQAGLLSAASRGLWAQRGELLRNARQRAMMWRFGSDERLAWVVDPRKVHTARDARSIASACLLQRHKQRLVAAWALLSGHVELLQWLHESEEGPAARLRLTRGAAQVRVYNPRTAQTVPTLLAMVQAGHTAALRYLVESARLAVGPTGEVAATALEMATINGDLPMLRFLCEELGLQPEIAYSGSLPIFTLAAADGQLEVLQYLSRRFSQLLLGDRHLCLRPSRDQDKSPVLHAMAEAAQSGQMVVLHFLSQTLCPSAMEVRRFDNLVLRRACAGGHLAVVRFLCEHYKLTLADVRVLYNEPLCKAAEGGHSAVVEYLLNRYALRAADASVAVNATLSGAARAGAVSVVTMLMKRFQLTPKDLAVDKVEAIRLASLRGHSELMVFLLDKGGETLESLTGGAKGLQDLLCRVAVRGDLPTMKVLLERLEFQPAMVEELPSVNWTVSEAVLTAASHGHLDLVQYMVETLHLSVDDLRDPHVDRDISYLSKAAAMAPRSYKRRHSHFQRMMQRQSGGQCTEYYAIHTPLTRAIENGHLSVVCYLIETVGMTAIDATLSNKHAMRKAAAFQYFAVLAYLGETLNVWL